MSLPLLKPCRPPITFELKCSVSPNQNNRTFCLPPQSDFPHCLLLSSAYEHTDSFLCLEPNQPFSALGSCTCYVLAQNTLASRSLYNQLLLHILHSNIPSSDWSPLSTQRETDTTPPSFFSPPPYLKCFFTLITI